MPLAHCLARGVPSYVSVYGYQPLFLPPQENIYLLRLVHAVEHNDRSDSRLHEFGIKAANGVSELPVLTSVGPFHGVQRVEDAVPVHHQRPLHAVALSTHEPPINELGEVPDPHRTAIQPVTVTFR